MIIKKYTEKSYVVTGTDTKEHKEELKQRGCKYNPNLKCGPGWIVCNEKHEEVKKYIDNFYDPTRPLTVAETLRNSHGTDAVSKKPELIVPVEEKYSVPPLPKEVIANPPMNAHPSMVHSVCDISLQVKFDSLQVNFDALTDEFSKSRREVEEMKEHIQQLLQTIQQSNEALCLAKDEIIHTLISRIDKLEHQSLVRDIPANIDSDCTNGIDSDEELYSEGKLHKENDSQPSSAWCRITSYIFIICVICIILNL
jgi:uncharacterized protein YheU (UPF0270 family)